MINAEVLRERRAAYLSGTVSHQEFYLWLADEVGVTADHVPFTLTRVAASKDPHLNDLPLRYWDARHVTVYSLARAKRLPWSMSDTVCVLKAVARRAVQG